MAERSNGLLEYIPGARPFFQQNSNGQPLEGFAENIRVSIREYVESAQNEIEKGHNFLQWVLTRVFEATEDDATDAILEMYSKLERDDISFILISGIIISMYNIVDIKKIQDSIKLPVIGVTYEESDGIKNAIKQHFPTSFESKIAKYDKLEKRTMINLHTGHQLYLRVEGCSTAEAKKLLEKL